FPLGFWKSLGARCWVSEGATLAPAGFAGGCGWVFSRMPPRSKTLLLWFLAFPPCFWVGVPVGGGCCRWVCGWCFDSWIVCASILYLWWPSDCGIRWMPWHQAPMKDVGGRDRPRGAVNRALIRGCPNGET